MDIPFKVYGYTQVQASTSNPISSIFFFFYSREAVWLKVYGILIYRYFVKNLLYKIYSRKNLMISYKLEFIARWYKV